MTDRKKLPTDPEVIARVREVWRELEGQTKSIDPLARDDMAAAYVAGEMGFAVSDIQRMVSLWLDTELITRVAETPNGV